MAILLVDDEPEFTDSVARNLRQEAWEILSAASGEEALAILRSRADLDILATDFHMPRMNGAELINRSLALRPDLYTIVFTGWSDREFAVQSLRLGADDFIDKQSNIDEELRRSVYRGLRQLEIARLGRELLRKNDERDVLNEALASLRILARSNGVCLFIRRLAANRYTIEQGRNLRISRDLPNLGEKLSSKSAYRFVIEERRPCFPPIFAPEGLELKPYLPEARSIIVVPAVFRNHELGAIGIEHPKAGRFQIEDLKFLVQVGDWISMAMDRLTALDRISLERGEREQGLLARALLHELKNPLNNLSTAVDIVMEKIEDDELNSLHDNVRRITCVIDRFLKPLTRHKEDKRPVSLDRIVGEAISRSEVADPIDSALVEFQVESELPSLEGNKEMLIAAFVSLLENAKKASGSNGRIIVQIIYVQLRNQIEIMISDDGPGIPSQDLPKIFDYGYTTKGEGHAGYGLALTQDIVQAHGGEISVHSTEGEGAIFKLKFPISCAQ